MCGLFGLLTFEVGNQEEITLSNLKALQSSADEVYCDQADQTSCTIRIGDVTGTSKGTVRGVH